MKKALLCLLLIAAVMCQGCIAEDKNINSSSDTDARNSDSTVIADKADQGPLFDAEKYSHKDVPSVTDAASLVQTEVFDDSYEYTYIVSIPKIESDASGAQAFNEKLYSKYEPLLDVAGHKADGGLLHQITYTSSDYDGIIVIHFNERYGLYQSESTGYGTTFYYDSVKDTELTKQEYLAHFGIDIEHLSRMSKWCLGDPEWSRVKYARTLSAADEDFINEPLTGELFFSFIDQDTEPEGYAVSADTVYAYCNVRGYTGSEKVVEIDVKSGQPKSPNFYISTEPTGVYDVDAEGMYVAYKDGKITDALVTKGVPVEHITITNEAVQIISDISYRGFGFDSYVEVNGKATESGGSSGLYGADKICDIYYFPRVDYTDNIVIKIINK